ncbi:choice-of-anchor J domain-containing protein [Corallibacter sp.]|uniref:choice-of-anchor J domain-containing protein n=1 Tax=Corallibacter sp. TaxID=2038084 RepID=UPI003A9219BA
MRKKLLFSVLKSGINFFKNNSNFNVKSQKSNTILILVLAISLLVANKAQAQFSETFESGIPNTWSLINNGVGTSDWMATTDGYLGTNAVSINPSADNIGDGNMAQYFLVTPQIAIPQNGEIHFYTKQSSEVNNGAQYQVRLSTAAQPDINGFNVTLQTYTEATLNVGSQTSYEKKVITIPESIPAGFNIYLAFVAVNTQNGVSPTGDEWFIDNLSVLEGCTEIDDSTVSIDDITVDSAEVTWTHSSATNFEIQILPEGGTPASSGIPVTGTSYTLMNLDPDTSFDIYLSAICDNDTQSEFTGPYNFNTLKYGLSCEFPIEIPDISSTPYVLAENLADWVNEEVSYSTQGSNCISGTSTANYLRGDKIFLSYTPTEDGLLSLSQTTFTGGDSTNNCYNGRSSLFVYDSCAEVGVNCLAGTTTRNGFVPSEINNFLVQAGQTYIVVVSSELSSGAGICLELEISSPTCAPPSEMTFNSLTENSVTFSWDNIGGFADSWEYAVVSAGSGEPVGSGTLTNTNIDNLINSGLTSGATYDFYVRSVCGGTPGIWSAPSTFTTQCTVFDTPYSTDFNNATNENPEPCWTIIDANNDGNQWSFIGGYPTVRTDLSRYENHDLYVSPQVNFEGTPKRLRFKHRATQGESTYTVKLSTTGVGVDNFTTIVVPETTINNTAFQEVMVDLPEVTGNVNIAWIVEPNNTETALRVSIDDVVIEDKPTCPDPINPFVLNVTETSAWLFWTVGEEETQWEVAIQDLDSGEPTGSGTLVSSNFPYMATDLEPGTQYEFYVRAYCAADDQSQWVGPVAFTTLCTSYDTPFFESFNDDDDDTQKFCWDTSNGGWTISETKAEIGGGTNAYLISPAINIDGVKELKFKYRAEILFVLGNLIPPRHGFEVLMSTTNNNPSSFTTEVVPFEVITNSGYIEKSAIIEGNGTIYIAFRVPPEFSGPSSRLNIDDVSIDEAPPCPIPSSLNVDTVTATGAEISWTAGYQEDMWNIVVQPEGTGVPTGTGISVDTNSYSAIGLEADSAYEVYLQSNCANGTSEWFGPVNFATICTPYVAPFVETFNSGSATKSCWIVIDDNYDLDTWELNNTAYPYEGDQTAAMFTGHNGRNEDWLISPTITITENQRLRYYYRVNDGFFTEDLEVLLSTNGTGIDQFTTVLYDNDDDPVLINNEEYRVKIINFPSGITGDINIAFHVPFYASTSAYRGQTLIIDNVNIEDIPECPEIVNITTGNLTDTEVQLSWEENGTVSPWEISVQPAGTNAPVGDTDPTYLYNATTNPFTITGLTASTAYDIYVRSACDNGDGPWTGPIEVTTLCSFENLCQYTFVLTSNTDVSAELQLSQNNQEVSQVFPFEGEDAQEFPVLLCNGVEFSLYFDTVGTYAPQYAAYSFEIRDSSGATIYTSPTGLTPRTNVYSGYSSCGNITCPTPTDLSINDMSVFSWSPGDSETEWEVAIQPVDNGTIPQSGTIVSTNSYTPTLSDFVDPYAVTYEYFVRAVCGAGDESYWAGPYVFVRNDDISNAITLPINAGQTCNESSINASFINTTVSSVAMSCDGLNAGDIWFNFTAESSVHIFELNDFTGNFRGEVNSEPPYPDITMTLYKDNGAGNLRELTCTYDNVLVAMYASKLIEGDNYKLRLTLNGTEANMHKFSVCVKTPEDVCDFNMAINGGFEIPVLQGLSGVNTIISIRTIPGWRQNLENSNSVFIWETLNAPGFSPYEGGQMAQVRDDGDAIDPNNPNIKGLYRDFDTSEITLLEYSFAHTGRFDGNVMELLAGPPEGPFTTVTMHLADQQWRIVSGDYQVPEGQDVTRFFFRANGPDNIGNLLDDVRFTANNEIITESFEVDCTNPTASVEANGTGMWLPSDANPGDVTIADANSNNTTITGFVVPGTYTFTWQTSHCSYDIELTYNGISDVPTVETPVDYCLNDTAEPLTATPTGTYSLVWYTQATGGTGSTTAPTPSTATVGSTSYYVANMDENGCESPRVEIEVNINDTITPELTFSYETVCIVTSENLIPELTAGFVQGGEFSSTTLTVDATTGEIDITSATAGSHDILYTYNGDTETCTLAGTYTASIEFTTSTTPVTTFDYGTEPFCLLAGDTTMPNLAAGFTMGGEFSSTTLTVDATTGEVDLTSGVEGSHDIVYTYVADEANCIEESVFTVSIEIVETITPVTAFTYSEDLYCTDSENVTPSLGTDFTPGGTFTAETGLIIDATTGEINPSASTTGNYTITYSVLEDLTICQEASTSTFMVTVLESTNPTTTFDYGVDSFCLLTGDTVLPNLDAGFTVGGTFSSATLTVDATTGEVDLASGAAGTHDITYTYSGDPENCMASGSYTTSIIIDELTTTNTTFTYTNDMYCADSDNIFPVIGTDFTTGGTFTAESGLVIDATTGEINVSASTLGNYTVTYQINDNIANCIQGSVSTFMITVLDTVEIAVEGACEASEYWLTASPVGNSFDPNEVTYVWMDANGNEVGQDSETFNVTAYAAQNPGTTIPAQFTVTVIFGGCSSTTSFTTETLSCNDIPRGISPDGNGKNDSFDLSGFGVVDLQVFNRYGKKVYNFKGTYVNQWHGQSNKGDELPDGTYFYNIAKKDGSTVTGWVYINRSH